MIEQVWDEYIAVHRVIEILIKEIHLWPRMKILKDDNF